MNLEGTQLGKYELQTEIGRGDLGIVYRGHDPDVARPVAIKVLHAELARDQEFARSFMRSAQTSARLNHPNIVSIYDMGADKGQYFFVMEYIEGQSLDQILHERGQMSSDGALSVLRQMSDGLDHAHAQGLVHGGVKPSNVMIDSGGRARMTDLGFVRPIPEPGITVSSTFVDSLRYISPEQASGSVPGTSSDLYSLAVVAYEMLTGVPPFDGSVESDILYKQVHEPPPPVISYRSDVPLAVEEVFDRALAKQPERRYWSAMTFVTSLAEALEGQPYPAAVPAMVSHGAPVGIVNSDPKPSGARTSRSLPWILLAGAAMLLTVVCVVALAAAVLMDEEETSSNWDVVAVLTEEAAPPPTTAPIETIAPPPATDTAPPEVTAPPDTSPTSTPAEPEPTEVVPVSDEPGAVVAVQLPVADVRAEPNNGSELVTQVVMGEKVMIQGKQSGWYEITAIDQPTPKDAQGYPGWVQAEAVALQVYDPERTAIVIVPGAAMRSAPAANGPVIHYLSIDSRLAFDTVENGWVAVSLPNGKTGWIAREDLRLICAADVCPEGVQGERDAPRAATEIIETAKQFLGTPYRWGGTSAEAFDCSGFLYRVFHANGVEIPRDSRPMSESGTWVERNELQPGDIIFNAQGGASGTVSHCALYVGNGQMITTVGTDPVAIIPVDGEPYRNRYWGARRYP
jgi:serine/threonine protein kinase